MLSPLSHRPERLVGLDVLRGLLIAAVIVLEIVATPAHPHLAHAAWNGLTVTDLVFPALLVVSGVSLAFALRGPVTATTWRRAVRRALALLVLGVLVLNNNGSLDLAQVRVTGVLQTFAVAGLLATTLVVALRTLGRRDRWWPAAVTAAVGIGVYQVLFVAHRAAAACVDPSGRCSPFHQLDVRLLGQQHLYRAGTAGWDPEGVVPVLAATLLVLAGWSAGVILRDHRLPRWIASAGLLTVAILLLLVVAPLLAEAVPVNKRLHTPAFQLTTIGWTLAALAAATVLFDSATSTRPIRAVRRAAAWPLETLGRNPLTMYILAHILGVTAASNRTNNGETWRDAFTDVTVNIAGSTWWGDPVFNYAFGLLAVMFLVAAAMRALDWKISL